MIPGKSTLQPFKELMARRCGLLFDGLAEANLAAALSRRMDACGTATPSAYYAALAGSDGEFLEFVALLTVNETYFYREPAQLQLLTECLAPRLLSRGASQAPVRILSAGCSTGEEPYSIAIALKEKFGESSDRLFSIVGVDIDHHALAKARRAEYGEFSFRALAPELRARHFVTRGPASCSLNDNLRGLVELHPLNLLGGPLPAALGRFDIVFFRNVSIYFDAATRRTILAHLHGAMEEGGALIVGASETMANDFGLFRLVEEEGGFYFVKTEAPSLSERLKEQTVVRAPTPRPAIPPRSGADGQNARPSTKHVVAEHRPPPPSDPWPEARDDVRLALREKRPDDAMVAAAALRAAAPGDLRASLLEGYVRLHMRQFAEAAAIASDAAERDAWSAEAHMLLGLAAKWQMDNDAAIGAFRRVTYSRPECWPAHYYLASMLQHSDPGKARREYATTMRQITANPDPDGGLSLPLDLPVADIRFLCERRVTATLEPADGEANRGS